MKIAVCVPVHGDTKSVFSQALARMIHHATRALPDAELEIFFERNTILVEGRNRLAEKAMRWGADWHLLLDADHYFEPDALLRLLAHDRDIVACNYSRRPQDGEPTGPVAWTLTGSHPVWTTAEKAGAALLEEVGGVGLGVCLIRASVMAALPAPRFDMARNRHGQIIGEDQFFFIKAREAGFKVWIDHALSWQIGHVGEAMLWNTTTLVDRARFEAKRA